MSRAYPALLATLALASCADVADSGDAAPPTDLGQQFDALRFDASAPPVRLDRGAPDVAVPPDDAAPPDMMLPPDAAPPGEACDGLDDDSDGQVDEAGACGPYIQAQCRLYLGWAGLGIGPDGPELTWGGCPADDRDRDDDGTRCSGTRGDGAFARLNLPAPVGAGHQLVLALQCADEAAPDLAAYVQSHCAVFFGWDATGRAMDGDASWSACPGSNSASGGRYRCSSSNFDGRFLGLRIGEPLGGDDALGVAWLCRDQDDPQRAENLTASAQVFLGWADQNQGALDGGPTWGPCPEADEGERDGQHCVGTRGDGAFRVLRLGGDVGIDDNLGVALRARRP